MGLLPVQPALSQTASLEVVVETGRLPDWNSTVVVVVAAAAVVAAVVAVAMVKVAG